MANSWPRTQLREHVDILLGFAFKSKGFSISPPGTRLVRGDNITEGRLRWGEKTRWWPRLTEELRRYLLRAGDVVIGMDGSKVGRNWAQVRDSELPLLLVQRVACLRARETLDQDLLAVLVGSHLFREHVDAVRTGSSIPHISGGQIGEFSFNLPPLSEQRAISYILGTLDDKIELNRRTNETLEAMARASFLRSASEEDWNEAPLGDVCTIYDGPHATPRLVESGPIFLGISNLADGLLDLSGAAHVTENDFIRWTRRVTPSHGDVVFSYETRLGQAALIPDDLVCCLGRRMGLLRPKAGEMEGVVLLRAFLGPEFQETIRRRTIHGSTVDRIPLKEMGKFPIRLPRREVMVRLANQLSPLRAKVESNENESRTLATLRDSLLPKLISGELRVKDAERRAEAVL